MTRVMSRLRRAAFLMFGLQVLQIVVLALSPVCDVMRADHGARAMTAITVAQRGPESGASHHHAHHVVSAAASPAPTSPEVSPAPDDTHGDHAECPMAMLCAVNAVAGHAPTIRMVDRQLASLVPNHAPTAPHSALRAPETPPPRT